MVNGPAVFRPVVPYRRVWRPVLTRFRRGVGTHPRDHGGSDTSNVCPKKYTSQKIHLPKNTPPKKYTSQKIHLPKNTPPKKYTSQKIHLPKNTPPTYGQKFPPQNFPPARTRGIMALMTTSREALDAGRQLWKPTRVKRRDVSLRVLVRDLTNQGE